MSERWYLTLALTFILIPQGVRANHGTICPEGTQLPSPNAQRVNLRVPGGCFPELEPCVEYMDCVNHWLAHARADYPPPVIIDIGAGTFDEFVCNGGASVTPKSSNITLRGSGRSTLQNAGHGVPQLGGTTIQQWRSNTKRGAAMGFTNCAGIEIQHLSIDARDTAIGWSGPGDSTYTDIEAVGGDYAWWEADITAYYPACPAEAISEHWSWSSTWRDEKTGLPGEDAYAWAATCSRSFFYDSEISGPGNAIVLAFDAEVRMFGSVVRVRVPDDSSFSTPGRIIGVANGGFFPGSQPAGEFHMHGGLIAVDASAETDVDVEAVGISSSSDGVSVTQETAFLIKGGGNGAARRLWDLGTVASPLLLAPGANPLGGGEICPPGSGAVISVGGYCSGDGQDVYVETDCLPSGDCESGSPAANETHLMVYSSSCDAAGPGAGPWFNTVTGKCRGDLLP